MKFAFVDGQRAEARPGLSGTCPTCEIGLVAKCGSERVWHWSHVGRRICDPWWENEGEWHRAWKANFPLDWQEFVFLAPDGERHIADVRTEQGWVFEFQHSFLNPAERAARNAFYPKLIWVVDGVRRKTDIVQFEATLQRAMAVHPSIAMWRVSTQESALLREWAAGPAPVFFDFGVGSTPEASVLWCVVPGSTDEGFAYVGRFSRASLLQMHAPGMGAGFDQLLATLKDAVSVHVEHLRAQRAAPPISYPTWQRGWGQPSQGRFLLRSRSRRRF